MFVPDSIEAQPLTPKQRIFCHEYVREWNATKAAAKAGYSAKNAHKIGSSNLQKQYIRDYIAYIQKDLAKLSGVSALKNIQELSKIAYSSIAHLHNSWIDLAEFEKLTDDQKSAIESIDTKTETKELQNGQIKTVQYVKIKLYNKIAAMELMNKMLSFNAPEKKDVKLEGIPAPTPPMSEELISKLIDKL